MRRAVVLVQRRSQWRMRQLARGGQVEVLCLAVMWLLIGLLLASVPVLVTVDVVWSLTEADIRVVASVWVALALAGAVLRMAAGIASPIRPAHLRPSDRTW